MSNNIFDFESYAELEDLLKELQEKTEEKAGFLEEFKKTWKMALFIIAFSAKEVIKLAFQDKQTWTKLQSFSFWFFSLSKIFQEDWMGDFLESRSQLIQSGASKWQIRWFSFWAIFGLFRSFLWFKCNELVSEWTERIR